MGSTRFFVVETAEVRWCIDTRVLAKPYSSLHTAEVLSMHFIGQHNRTRLWMYPLKAEFCDVCGE